MRFVIPGPPIAKQRHRTCMRGGRPAQYDKQDKVKESIRTILMDQVDQTVLPGTKQYQDYFYINCKQMPCAVSYSFYLPIPSSTKKQKNCMLWGLDLHDHKPDIDNLAKMYLDCQNGILYQDDRQVVSLKCRKIYSEDPRVEIDIVPTIPVITEGVKGILCHISPKEFVEFSRKAHDLAQTLQIRTHASVAIDPELDAGWYTETALLLSNFADQYADILRSIKKKDKLLVKKIVSLKEFEGALERGEVEKCH